MSCFLLGIAFKASSLEKVDNVELIDLFSGVATSTDSNESIV